MSRPIDAVVFDYGGVLSASPFLALGRIEERLGVAPGSISNALGFGLDVPEPEPGEPHTNAFHLLEMGKISLQEYGAWANERVREVFGPQSDVGSTMSRGFGEMGVHWMVVHRAQRLKAEGYRLGICTNNIASYRDTWTAHIPMDLWDVVVDSSEVGVRKPDPAIYELTCEALGVAPHRAVFLDDHPRNVAAAVEVGMHGILVGPDPWPALHRLDEILAGSAGE